MIIVSIRVHNRLVASVVCLADDRHIFQRGQFTAAVWDTRQISNRAREVKVLRAGQRFMRRGIQVPGGYSWQYGGLF